MSVCANLALVAMEETVSRGVPDSNLGWLQNVVEHAVFRSQTTPPVLLSRARSLARSLARSPAHSLARSLSCCRREVTSAR